MILGPDFIEGILLGGLTARGRASSPSRTGFGGSLAAPVAQAFSEYDRLPMRERRRRLKSAIDRLRPAPAVPATIPPLAGAAIARLLSPAQARMAEREAGPRRPTYVISTSLEGLLQHYAAAPSCPADHRVAASTEPGGQP